MDAATAAKTLACNVQQNKLQLYAGLD